MGVGGELVDNQPPPRGLSRNFDKPQQVKLVFYLYGAQSYELGGTRAGTELVANRGRAVSLPHCPPPVWGAGLPTKSILSLGGPPHGA